MFIILAGREEELVGVNWHFSLCPVSTWEINWIFLFLYCLISFLTPVFFLHGWEAQFFSKTLKCNLLTVVKAFSSKIAIFVSENPVR